jgi:hypothetical protein
MLFMMSRVLLLSKPGLREVIAEVGAAQEYCSDPKVGPTSFQSRNTAS